MAEVAVTTALALVDYIIYYTQQETSLPQRVRSGVAGIKSLLGTMQAFLKDMEARGTAEERDELQKDRITQVRDIAHEIEDALDEFMLSVPIHTHHHTLNKLGHNVKYRSSYKTISSKIETIQNSTKQLLSLEGLRLIGSSTDPLSRGGSSSSGTSNLISVNPYSLDDQDDDTILGFDQPRDAIMSKLIDHGSEPRRKLIALVGSGGSGKSVLAKMVYYDRRARSNFECHAWVLVTSPFQLKDVLQNLSSQLSMKNGTRLSEEGAADIQETLRNYLEFKQYMIVLDNIWRKEDWESIVSSLPKGLSGSAIIVITRSMHVVEHSNVATPYYIHSMGKLPIEIALQLFYKKAFYANDGKCPLELEELSRQIVERCEGDPFAIATIGCLLSKKHLRPREWKTVLNSLESQIGSDHSNLSIIAKRLLPSYNDLPCHLKSCLLYMGAFPEVKRGKLIRSWIAEGFVNCDNGKTLEEVAEDYLNDLIGRNLVQVISSDFDGRLRDCRVANLVRGFIVMKAEEDVFLTVLPDSNTSSPHAKGCRRISTLTPCTDKMLQNVDLSRVRTLFTLVNRIDHLPKLNSFKLLKVLDMQNSTLDSFPKEIFGLSLLRYLSVRNTNISLVPESINKLSNLETLDLKHTQIKRLPQEIFHLRKLRHLLVYSYATGPIEFDHVSGVEVFSGIGDLHALQKLTLIKASYPLQKRSIVEDLGKLVHLRKLGLIDLKKEDGVKLCSSIEKMTSLSTLDVRSRTKEECIDLNELRNKPPVLLQRLYLKGRLSTLPEWIHSLHSIVRIGLRCSRLENSPLDTLGELPHLIELQMADAFVGQELCFVAKKFEKLKILVIDKFEYLNTILVYRGALPNLKSLSICRSQNLSMLPFGLCYAQQLEKVTSYGMPDEFITQLERYRKDQLSDSRVLVVN